MRNTAARTARPPTTKNANERRSPSPPACFLLYSVFISHPLRRRNPDQRKARGDDAADGPREGEPRLRPLGGLSQEPVVVVESVEFPGEVEEIEGDPVGLPEPRRLR